MSCLKKKKKKSFICELFCRLFSCKRKKFVSKWEVEAGERLDFPISLCRELTKLHEEVVRTTLGEAVARYSEAPPKGEFVLIVAGAPEEKQEIPSETDAAARVAQLMTEGVSRKDAVKQTAKELGLSKNAVYDIALKDAEEINS